MVLLLMKHGANAMIKDDDGNTALHCACRSLNNGDLKMISLFRYFHNGYTYDVSNAKCQINQFVQMKNNCN